MTDQDQQTFDQAAEGVVELGNKMLDDDDSADIWDVASGVLTGAVQYWLFSRQPCSNPMCEACAETGTAQRRMKVLLAEVQRLAEDSDCYDSPGDIHSGAA